MSNINNPHDKFFKETFSRPEIVRDFLQNYLPAELVNLLNLDSLELQKDNFVDDDLQEHFSDLLYKVQLHDGRFAYIYFLFEHKSYPDPFTAFQLLHYLLRIWTQELREDKNRKTLTAVFPLVIYHGRSTWQISRHFKALFNAPAALMPYLPDFQYNLHDLSTFAEGEIRGQVALQAYLLLLKYILNEQLSEQLPLIFILLREAATAEDDLTFIYTVMRYVSQSAPHVTEAQLKETIIATFAEKGEALMSTIAEKWIEQGLEQGLEQGQKAMVRSIIRVLQRRFQHVPANVPSRLEDLTLDELETLLDAVMESESVLDFMTHLPSQE